MELTEKCKEEFEKWLCWTKYNGNRLSEGKTASNAWVNAKKNIKEELSNS